VRLGKRGGAKNTDLSSGCAGRGGGFVYPLGVSEKRGAVRSGGTKPLLHLRKEKSWGREVWGSSNWKTLPGTEWGRFEGEERRGERVKKGKAPCGEGKGAGENSHETEVFTCAGRVLQFTGGGVSGGKPFGGAGRKKREASLSKKNALIS